MLPRHPTALKFWHAANALGHQPAIVEFTQPTRTAEEAAAAVGCGVGQIVKSLCFSADTRPVIALVSGANQLDTARLAAALGTSRKKVQRADAELVRQATGYAIGGVPPFGHIHPLPTWIDSAFLQYDTIWAAAGTPNAVFPISPHTLVALSGGTLLDLARATLS
jgi:Cys-tRNA(Pro) deacylase